MATSPIKRSKALVALSREHHFDLLLAWKLRQGLKAGVALARMAAYVRYLHDHLIAAHLKDEEALLFDRLPEEDVMCAKARRHHGELRQLISQVTDDKNEDTALFGRLSDLLEEHVRYEERELFPYLEQKLSPGVLSAAEKEIAERHKGFAESWQDAFWEQS